MCATVMPVVPDWSRLLEPRATPVDRHPTNPRLSAVLAETATALRRHGYDRLSVETLARRAGVSRSTVYRHWSNKRALVVAAVDDFLDRHAPVPEPQAHVDAISQLAAFAHEAGALAADPQAARTAVDLVRSVVADDAMRALWQESVIDPRRVALSALLRQAARQGDLRPELDVDVAVDALVGAVTFRLLFGAAPVDDHFGRMLVATVVAGFDHVEEHFPDLVGGVRSGDGHAPAGAVNGARSTVAA